MGSQKEAEAAAYEAPEDRAPPPPYYQETYHTDAYAPPPRPLGPAPTYEAGGPSSGAGPLTKFPASLNAYMKMGFTRVMHLGERKEAPLFAVRMHSGFTKNPELVMYDGPSDKDDAVLATGTHQSLWKVRGGATLTVAAREGVAHDADSQTVRMATHSSLRHTTHGFTADVGAAGTASRHEQFEWRSSHGGEVRELDGYKWGWKLVRLSGEPVGAGGGRDARVLGSTSDGLEVVAAWAHNNSLSMSKAFKFQFMGSALTGALGERGATLAIISAMWLWLLELNSSAAGGAASAGAAAAAAAAAAASG